MNKTVYKRTTTFNIQEYTIPCFTRVVFLVLANDYLINYTQIQNQNRNHILIRIVNKRFPSKRRDRILTKNASWYFCVFKVYLVHYKKVMKEYKITIATWTFCFAYKVHLLFL
jgi:hypothetical protein